MIREGSIEKNLVFLHFQNFNQIFSSFSWKNYPFINIYVDTFEGVGV